MGHTTLCAQSLLEVLAHRFVGEEQRSFWVDRDSLSSYTRKPALRSVDDLWLPSKVLYPTDARELIAASGRFSGR